MPTGSDARADSPPLPDDPVTVDAIQLDPRYRPGELLGVGGRHAVFAATDLILGRQVAVKVAEGAPGGPAEADLLAEARMIASLDHAHILPVLDVGLGHAGAPFITMRRFAGRSLAELIDQAASGSWPDPLATLGRRIELFLKVCEAVAYAHHQGVIHRDLKPGNIMVGDFGDVAVVDWGDALRLRDAPGETEPFPGTPLYCAPEQARGEPADERTDVWGLGATLFHILWLRPPLWRDDPEEFSRCKRSGLIDAPDVAGLPPVLVQAVLTALAPRPEERHHQVRDLISRLRAWQEDAAADGLCQEAEILLRDGKDLPYARYEEAADILRQALRLRPDYARALSARTRVRRAHIATALMHGDLALASGLAESGDSDLLADISAAQRRRDDMRRRSRRFRLAAAAALLLAVSVLGLLGRDLWLRHGRWQQVIDRTAASGASLTVGLGRDINRETDSTSVLPAEGGDWRLDTHQLIWLDGVQVAGPVRVSVELDWMELVDGFEIHVNARRDQGLTYNQSPSGYVAQFAGYLNTQHIAGIMLEPGSLDIGHEARAEPLGEGRHTLVFEARDGRLVLSIDGRTVLQRDILVPVTGPLQSAIALRSWQPVRIHAIRVERLAAPQLLDPLAIGDFLRSSGHPSEAVAHWLAVADDHPGSSLARSALLRAALSATRLPPGGISAGDLRRRMVEMGNTDQDLLAVDMALSSLAWREGRPVEALDLAESCLGRDPSNGVLQLILAQPHRPLPEGLLRRLLGLIRTAKGRTHYDLTGLGIVDLSPLNGLPLTSLHLAQNDIADLEPLRGMPLRHLNVTNNFRLRNLAPLTGMPLLFLNLGGARIKDLHPLAGMPLRSLYLGGLEEPSLAALAGMPLHSLGIGESRLADLTPLRGMPLQRLSLGPSRVFDISALAGMPLRYLGLAACGLSDLSPLHGTPLVSLNLAGTRVRDLSPLAGNTRLETLLLSHAPVSDLGPLSGLSLHHLEIDHTQVSDLAPLHGLPLKVLDVGETPVADLTACAGMHLRTCDCDGTAVADLQPIVWPGLTHVDCSRSRVRDLSVLDGATGLRELLADGLQPGVAWGTLAEHPPATMMIDRAAMPATWAFREERVGQVRQILARDAVARESWDDLRRLAEPWRGRKVLILDLPMTRDRAKRVASLAGGRLWLPRDADELTALRTDLWRRQGIRPYYFAWFGVSNDLMLDDDGRPLPFRLPGVDLLAKSPGLFALPLGFMENHDEPIRVYPPHLRNIMLSILEWPTP